MSDKKRDQANPPKSNEEGRSIAREEPNRGNAVRDFDPPPELPRPPEPPAKKGNE